MAIIFNSPLSSSKNVIAQSFTGSLFGTASHVKVSGSGVIVNWDRDTLQLTGSAQNASQVFISQSSPGVQPSGSLWWSTDDGNLYVQTEGPSGSSFVAATNTIVGAAGNAVSASYATTADTASYFITSSVTSASFSQNALSASYFITSSVTSASFAQTASVAGGALSASHAVSALSASHAVSALTASHAITASYVKLEGGGAVLVNFTGSWTVTPGTNTYSFTVDSGATYTMWLYGNVPNGIIGWNCTATISNTNVPVVGVQYAWVYTGGGTPIDITSIPDQFVGTSGSIMRTVGTGITFPTNTFRFGINNTSVTNRTVYYGYTKQ